MQVDTSDLLLQREGLRHRQILQAVLQYGGAVVSVTATARDALGVLERVRADVVLTDVALPVEDGYWLVQHLRGWPAERGGRVPVVAMTPVENPRDKVLAAGFTEHIPKPILIGRLSASSVTSPDARPGWGPRGAPKHPARSRSLKNAPAAHRYRGAPRLCGALRRAPGGLGPSRPHPTSIERHGFAGDAAERRGLGGPSRPPSKSIARAQGCSRRSRPSIVSSKGWRRASMWAATLASAGGG